ncbi:MAG: hypothetical protein K1X94_28220 [Sandaracinaceae bacterium]|nr:hypothetical protein [Sandaracinaceae bacterium]
MIVPVDALFRAEREAFDLRMSCEDCALFDDARAACAHGYPTEPHRRPADWSTHREVQFCKDFETR